LLRTLVLALTFVVAYTQMRDVGFTPMRGKGPVAEVKQVLRDSIEHGLRNPPVLWVMLGASLTGGVVIYAFYAAQPYLLHLYGNERAYAIAGLAAAIFAGAQVVGGLLVPHISRLFRRRTSVLLVGTSLSAVVLAVVGLVPEFWIVIALLAVWALIFAANSARSSGESAAKSASRSTEGLAPLSCGLAPSRSSRRTFATSARLVGLPILISLLARLGSGSPRRASYSASCSPCCRCSRIVSCSVVARTHCARNDSISPSACLACTDSDPERSST
jgi:hypothetical protein